MDSVVSFHILSEIMPPWLLQIRCPPKEKFPRRTRRVKSPKRQSMSMAVTSRIVVVALISSVLSRGTRRNRRCFDAFYRHVLIIRNESSRFVVLVLCSSWRANIIGQYFCCIMLMLALLENGTTSLSTV